MKNAHRNHSHLCTLRKSCPVLYITPRFTRNSAKPQFRGHVSYEWIFLRFTRRKQTRRSEGIFYE